MKTVTEVTNLETNTLNKTNYMRITRPARSTNLWLSLVRQRRSPFAINNF